VAYSAPRTWVAGEHPTAAQMNANVRDNVAFLANPPACRVYHNANQSIAATTETTLAFNSERFDTAALHDTVTNNGRITIPTAGLYVVSVSVEWAAGTGAWQGYVNLRVDGATTIASDRRLFVTGGTGAHAFATIYKFTAAQYVEVRVWQNSGTLNVVTAANYSPEFAATWIGLG
jgi:hypothetical protein